MPASNEEIASGRAYEASQKAKSLEETVSRHEHQIRELESSVIYLEKLVRQLVRNNNEDRNA